MDTVYYVGGVLKGAGDTITSSVEAMVDTVIDDPSIVTGVIDSVASTIMDGITYFPDVILDEIDPELSHGAKSRTNQRIDNVLDGISESISQLEEDYVKHQKAVAAGDFESAGAVVGEYMASAVLPSKKVKVLSKGPNDNLSFTGNYKKELIKLKDVEFIDLYYKKRDRSEYNQLRKDFNNRVRKEFLKELSLDEGALTQLRQHGVSESEILKLSNGKVPKGYQVHHKIPLDDGGNNDKDNLVLIRNSPEHSIFTTYQKQKTSLLEVGGEGVNIEWPIPKWSVYPEDVD
ncbi:hypothetical protein JCM19237_1279 [Photobacterium aphoticum]|uniref:HNH domain-containing protein n=1 Tax=Photobacterium aphoticum TaxID=754436 RepID=A0A090RAK2_9GAMM|nr:hypothetical protein JCM19237_1279 [Photobacterium aphoticum]